MKGFYNGLKEVWGPKKKGPVHLISTAGMETSPDSNIVVARWSEHFQFLFNIPGGIDHEALDNITKTCFDEIPTMDDMARAIAGLQDGKAPGGDGLLLKYGSKWIQSVQQTAPTSHQCLGGGFCTTSMEGCQHCNNLQ